MTEPSTAEAAPTEAALAGKAALADEATLQNDGARVRNAYEELYDEICAVPQEELLQITVDIPTAATSLQGALPEIMSLRPRIARLPEFHLPHLDKLGKYAMAMDHANTVHAMKTKPAGTLAELAKPCEHIRELLLAEINTAVVRGILEGGVVKELRGANSYRGTVFDTFALAHIARSNWSRLEGKTALTLAEVLRAEQLADQLNVALGQREQGPSVAGPTAEIRNRAFTLFMRAFQEVYRAVLYLEPKRVDDIMPALRATRGPSKKAPDGSDETETSEPDQADASPAQEVPAGMPGASPFVRS